MLMGLGRITIRRRNSRHKVHMAVTAGVFGLLCRVVVAASAQQVDMTEWGRITSPVYGTTESGVYSGAELFAGPHKLGARYYDGVLPNGRIVRPAGETVQIGMSPLGVALTPDGRFLITTNDDDRGGPYGGRPGLISLQNPVNQGGYSLSVIDAATLKVVSQINTAGKFFVGLQVTGKGPYRVWASGGGDQNVKLFDITIDGMISVASTASIPIPPSTHSRQDLGFVSNYSVSPSYNKNVFPSPASSTSAAAFLAGARITFPAGSALSPDGRFLYVACNGDESLAVIDTATLTTVQRVETGYFPFGVAVSKDGHKVFVTNWGVTEYRFHSTDYDPTTGQIRSLAPADANLPEGFFVPPTSTSGARPKTSSVSVVSVPNGDGTKAISQRAIYEGRPLDALFQVGDTHPSAAAIVDNGKVAVLYVTRSNDDSLGLIRLDTDRRLHDFDLSPLPIRLKDRHRIQGAYPNALVAAPDQTRVYVAEAGINSVAVLDTSDPIRPKLLGRIPTGWYPSGLAISPDGKTLYIVNAKGIGEDVNPTVPSDLPSHPTGVESFEDSNFVFGSLQEVNLTTATPDCSVVLAHNFAVQPSSALDTTIVPIGGGPSAKIKHVFFILHENKSFDSMLGSLGNHFGSYSAMSFVNPDGTVFEDRQNTGVDKNLQLLATTFAAAVNYYSDSEESDAGHQFCASGTATDYTEKTLVAKAGRGLLVNKNMEPEDYPAGGYLFNNAARHGISFKDYGDLIRTDGTDTGASVPAKLNDLPSGNLGYPVVEPQTRTRVEPVTDAGDVRSATRGLGQSYFMDLPGLAVLGSDNRNGEPHLDRNYPGYNFNISDQRRALEFIRDFDRMVKAGRVPQYLHIYLPNDHTGTVQAHNIDPAQTGPMNQIADGDVALGMIVSHIMHSPLYYEPKTGEGSAIFITFDDAQGSKDHIHPHRTPLVLVSPYAKAGYLGKRHVVSASIVKTTELLLGLPPNNYGDLFATDLRDLFQPTYNNIQTASLNFGYKSDYRSTPEGRRLWALAEKLDTSAPDRDSRRLSQLARLSAHADEMYRTAESKHHLEAPAYHAEQQRLYREALLLVDSNPVSDD